MRKIIAATVLLGFCLTSSGCVVGLAAGAGAVVADEISENDGEFDPLEEAYDGDPDTDPLIKE